LSFITRLFSSDFMPHGHCYLWQPDIVWLHVASDGFIALAYYSIPVALLYFVRRRTDLAFNWMFVMFAAFIFGCGSTHVMEVWTVWHGTYRLAGVVKLLTAGLSVGTAVALWPLIPRALALPSTSQLEAANARLRREVEDHAQARAALVATQDKLNAILRTAPNAVITMDADGLVLDWNPRAEQTFGWTAQEAVGRSMADLIVPARYRTAHRDGIARFLATGVGPVLNTRLELSGLRRDGTEIPVELTITAIRLGERFIFSAFLRDIAARKASEQALRESEERFRLLVEGVVDYAIILLDPHGRIASWNEGAQRITGYRSDEIVGQHLAQLYLADDFAEGKPDVALRIAAEEGRYENEDWRIRRDGSTFWANSVISAVRGARGELVGFSTVMRDLTERQRTESRFQSLLEAAPDAIIIVDPRGSIVYVNSRTEALFGYKPEELRGQPVEHLIPQRAQSGHVGHRADYFAHPHPRPMGAGMELHGRRKDGSEFPVEISLSPLDTPDGPVAISAVRDVTDRKRAEDALRSAKTAAELYGRELEAFSYSVAHDLRAPLRAIDGFSKVLLDQHANALTEKGRDFLHRVRANSVSMARLIDDLLALSHVTRSVITREPVDLSALADDITSSLKRTQPDRAVDFAIERGLWTEGDHNLLRVVLENLLNNAWKYTSRHDRARIEFGCRSNAGRQVFHVQDDGAGFDMAYVRKLFVPFSRLHTVAEFEGSGVGLATVHRIIERHHGRIWGEGAVEAGATFYFTLWEGVHEQEDSAH
jgi:PAS domain S-box-containing protein